MADEPAPFPTRVEEPRSDGMHPAPRPQRLRHPLALFAVTTGLGLLAAIVVGGATGAFVIEAGGSDCSASDGWCKLGAAVIGLIVGVVIGAIAYLVAGVMVITRCRPRGHRGTHVLVHIVSPFALIVVSVAMSELM